jgi:hypothetical protein
MRHTYKTKEACSTAISFDLGGAVQINETLSGIHCGAVRPLAPISWRLQ